MNCRKCHKLEGAYFDGRIEGRMRDAFEAHLASCPSCGERIEQTNRLVSTLQNFGAKKSPVDVWPAVSEKLAALDRSRRQVRPRLALRLISIPALTAVGAALVLLFWGLDLESGRLKHSYQQIVSRFHKSDQEYLQYVQAYSQFQSEQSLDSDPMNVVAELSRERAWPGE